MLDRDRMSTARPEPELLVGVAVRHRRRRWMFGLLAAAVAATTAVTLVVFPPGASRRHHVGVPPGLRVGDRAGEAVQLVANVQPAALPRSTAAAKAVADAEQAFTFVLLRQTHLRHRSVGNVVLSPSSLAIALSMLQNGAAGQTRDEIAQVLQARDLSTEQQNAGWAALAAELTAAAKPAGLALESANSLWLQQNLPMQPEFLAAMARSFNTGVWQVDFNRRLAAAADAINAWTAAKTHGKISTLFADGDIDPATELVLANAVYFKAAWQYQFDASLTKEAPFYAAGGGTVSAQFMATTESANPAVSVTNDYQAVQLPYAGGRFGALVLMPYGQLLQPFVDGLTPARLRQITTSLTERPIDLRLPRFTVQQYTNLKTVMEGMGMVRAFSAYAQFPALSSVPLAVQSVVQRDYLAVDEHGTEAAAVTGIGMATAAYRAPQRVVFDHPFLLLVRDTKTGTILFASEVQNPAG